MKTLNILKLTMYSIAMMSLVACGSSQNSSSNTQQGQRGQERPTVSQILSEMDANKDGKLSKEEVKGPLAQDFDTIDTNDDGFISKEELENAPQPQRNNQRGGQRGGGRG
jgi:Ca2+-binding EF-hand superfamily protein